MTRKLLLTAAIVALALTPSIGTGTAQARGFGGGGFGGGFHGGFGGGFHGGGFGSAAGVDGQTVAAANVGRWDHLRLVQYSGRSDDM
jgi:hypothetical protein